MIVRIHRLCQGQLPEYKSEGAAGMDCYVRSVVVTETQIMYRLGFRIEIPRGYVGLIFPRSSVVHTPLRMANAVGVIDSDYRGEVTATFDSDTLEGTYAIGERCCQLVIVPAPEIELLPVEDLLETERGEGGYGSTGR